MSALRLCGRLLHKPDVVDELLELLGLVLELNDKVVDRLAGSISVGLLQVMKKYYIYLSCNT